MPCWKDLNPRLGASYDLFGNGRTAFKVSLGRYVDRRDRPSLPPTIRSMTSVNSVNRTWNDANGNYVPDCDLTQPGRERRVRTDQQPELRADQPEPPAMPTTCCSGFGDRDYIWDFATEVQHQLGRACR